MPVDWTGAYRNRHLLSWITAVALLLAVTTAHGQQKLPLVEAYKQAMSAFDSGNYPAAIAGLNGVLKDLAADSPQLDEIQFTLGAAYFNNKNYADAVRTFSELIQKFPNSARIQEAKLSLAQAQMQAGDKQSATTTLKELEKIPQYREQALLMQAAAARNAGQIDNAIAFLEQLKPSEIASNQSAQIATELASLYIQKGLTDKAGSLLAQLQNHVKFVENLVDLNTLTLALGDKFLSLQKYNEALACFRDVRLKKDLISFQQQQIATMEKRIAENLKTIQKEPARRIPLLAANDRIRQTLDSARKSLAKFEGTPEITGALYLRMAQCFDQQEQFWNSIVVYDELLDRTTVAAERESALFALATNYAQAEQLAATQAAAERYLKEFPTGANAPAMNYLRAEMALRQKKYDEAEGMFAGLIESDPKGALAQQIRILLGNSKFSQGDYDEAILQYRKYLKQFPKGELVEEAKYRITLSLLFAGKYDDAIKWLRAYLKQNPDGSFAADAKYRLAVCDYAAQDYERVVKACKAWRKEYPEDPQNAEVSSLLGDAYAALGDTSAAIEAYRKACDQQGVTAEVLNYSIFEAAKILQRESRWEDISTMFENFVSTHPDHPVVASALFWIGKAKARLGKLDEARKFLADTANKYIDDPIREAVEPILTQLAEIYAKDPELAKSGNADQQLKQSLETKNPSPTRTARILYAQAELARIRKETDRRSELLRKIAKETNLDDLSPILLGLTGDQLLRDGNLDGAGKIYAQLLDYYPKSPVVDYAYTGLGQVALEKKEYRRALQYFTDGLEKIVPTTRLKDLTLGQAKALLELNKLDQAQKLFEQVASTREWRGEATAESLYALGEIQWRQEKWAEANAFFQRLFVTYGKFPKWVARSYLRSAECFVKLGKNKEAASTLKEMLHDAPLANLPETQIAADRLKQIPLQ